MGTYINPGNVSFQEINSSDYVDKSLLIDSMNQIIGSNNSLVCISRPRRFGKTYAAKMLASYYDCSCDSHELFDDKKIAGCSSYERHLNKYNVICFDVTSFISAVRRKNQPLSSVTDMIVESLRKELIGMFSYLDKDMSLTDCILRCAEGNEDIPGRKFVFIIDEWDALVREAKDDLSAQMVYFHLLREWFNNVSFISKAVAAVFMTGILPIKRGIPQFDISEFREYTMIDQGEFAEYTGFTDEEVRSICEKYDADFEMIKFWYAGYSLINGGSVYNPYSVMKALKRKKYQQYWTQTSSPDALWEYISKDYNGLTQTIEELMAGIEVNVTTTKFKNDLTNFKSKDDVITLLIHLGYLAYDCNKKTARIPNEEIRQEFQDTIREYDHSAIFECMMENE